MERAFQAVPYKATAYGNACLVAEDTTKEVNVAAQSRKKALLAAIKGHKGPENLAWNRTGGNPRGRGLAKAPHASARAAASWAIGRARHAALQQHKSPLYGCVSM